MDRTNPPPPRRLSAAILRAYLAVVESRGRSAAVRARLGPEAAKLFDAPPLQTSWCDADLMLEIYRAIADAGGRDELRQVSYEAMKGPLGRTLRALLGGTIALYGRSPAEFLSHLDAITQVVLREVTAVYLPVTETSGIVELRYRGPAPEVSIIVWEGIIQWFLEQVAPEGEALRAEVLAGGHTIRVPVRWPAASTDE